MSARCDARSLGGTRCALPPGPHAIHVGSPTAWIVQNDEVCSSEFDTEDAAVAHREELGGLGIETWVVPIEAGSLVREEAPC